jgi:hypothetical protein
VQLLDLLLIGFANGKLDSEQLRPPIDQPPFGSLIRGFALFGGSLAP